MTSHFVSGWNQKKSFPVPLLQTSIRVKDLEGWTAHPEFGCLSLFAFFALAGSQPPREQSTTPPFVLLNVPCSESFSREVRLRKTLSLPLRLLSSYSCRGLRWSVCLWMLIYISVVVLSWWLVGLQ